MTETYAIEVQGLTKKFGNFTAVDNISFNVNDREIFGFLGPNGAGKSTTIRMLCTLARPTAGDAKVNGYDLLKQPDQVRESIGLVAEKMIMYEQLTAAENLRFFGNLYQMPKQKIETRIDELLKLVDMTDWKNTQIKKFSTGMRQRINVIRALLTEPKVIFMDEPTLGLDPQTTLSIRELIRDINKNGTTVILTTHAMMEAEVAERPHRHHRPRQDHRARHAGKPEEAGQERSRRRPFNSTDTKPYAVARVERSRSWTASRPIDQQDAYDLKISARGSEAFDQITIRYGRTEAQIAYDQHATSRRWRTCSLSVTGKAMRDQANEKAPGERQTPRAVQSATGEGEVRPWD